MKSPDRRIERHIHRNDFPGLLRRAAELLLFSGERHAAFYRFSDEDDDICVAIVAVRAEPDEDTPTQSMIDFMRGAVRTWNDE